MEAVILTKEQFDKLNENLEIISRRLENQSKNPDERFIDNSEFLQLMRISKRTAQTWRDEGKISFSQIGAKIYYKLSDVQILLGQNYRKSYLYKDDPRLNS